MFWSSGYNDDRDAVSEATGLACEDKSRTIQSQAAEADINTIVRRFGLTGQLPVNHKVPLNIDFEDVFDYQTAMNVIAQANQSFMAMPADVRSRFGNDPGLFVDFCSDPANVDELRKLGLAVPLEVKEDSSDGKEEAGSG